MNKKDIITRHSDKIIETIYKYLPRTQKEWELVGFVNKDNDVYTFGNDSKIIGRLFEVMTYETMYKAAEELGYELHESTKQTVYPDYYFLTQDNKKIAIDIKTTYQNTPKSKFGFTGGSFTSFLRNGTKNIVGHYDDYIAHYILGIVYVRELEPTLGRVNIHKRKEIIPAYKDVQFFIQEKYRICGDKKGSGNTDNIGTIKANNIKPFEYGAGPFSYLGEDIFNDYWKNHPKYTDSKDVATSLYRDLPTYFDWLEKSDREKANNLKEKYQEYLRDYRAQEELGKLEY
ncbi:type II restriction endonuclease [Aerococcus urinaeequi]|uniref:type II restriction endonuclease n=1 Tax=Aerococcus urinaeequi TaxID=51665 RepID=UPI003B3B3D52